MENEFAQVLANFEKYAQDNVEISIFKFKHTAQWQVIMEKRTDGIELKVTGTSLLLIDAMSEAETRWNRSTAHGIKEFAGKLLEAPVAMPINGRDLDDDIPF